MTLKAINVIQSNLETSGINRARREVKNMEAPRTRLVPNFSARDPPMICRMM